jgi:hypothetical protein
MTTRIGRALPLAALLVGLGTAVAGTSPGAAAASPTAQSRAAARAKAAASAVAIKGTLRRSDLGTGFSQATPAPKRPAELACTANRNILAAEGSPTWSQAEGQSFVSNDSYGLGSAAAARAQWSHDTLAPLGRCLERQLAEGSGHGVKLTASGVRQLPPPTLPSGLGTVQLRRYRVSGTASGDGQQLPVTLDVILVSRGAWIGEDQFSAINTVPGAGVERRVLVNQVRRVLASGG